jgi:hypothetical protein
MSSRNRNQPFVIARNMPSGSVNYRWKVRFPSETMPIF